MRAQTGRLTERDDETPARQIKTHADPHWRASIGLYTDWLVLALGIHLPDPKSQARFLAARDGRSRSSALLSAASSEARRPATFLMSSKFDISVELT